MDAKGVASPRPLVYGPPCSDVHKVASLRILCTRAALGRQIKHKKERAYSYSDGLVEAHDPYYEMFFFLRLGALIVEHGNQRSLVDSLLKEPYSFVGES